MGFDEISEEPHGAYCQFLSSPSQRKQTTMPRSFVKTWIGSIAYPIWVTLPRELAEEYPYYNAGEDRFWQLGPNMRVLLSSYVISNVEKMIALIRKTYESNTAMQVLFPEVIPPNFNKTRWNNQSACINRDTDYTESTFEASGIGGASTSRHYDLLIEDDLIYARKDDLSNRELQPNQEDIDKAIGWHKIATSLLVPGDHTHIHNQGTRWAKHDLVDYIGENEPDYELFIRGAVDLRELEELGEWRKCKPVWEKCFSIKQLERIERAQGPFMFATQYLLQPTSPNEAIFKKGWLQYYVSDTEIPSDIRKFTTVDLAEWTEARSTNDCNAVVLTCGIDTRNHLWVLHYDVGRFDPSKIIELMAKHWKIFSPEAIGIESVYYQKAIGHFAHRYMDENKIPRMTIRQLKPEGNVSKDLRIRALEPYASSLAIHCKETHVEFITEFAEYIPNSRICKKDILDAMAYQVQIGRPGEPAEIKKPRIPEVITMGNLDEFLEHEWNKGKDKDIFGHQVTTDPYADHMDDGNVSYDPYNQ